MYHFKKLVANNGFYIKLKDGYLVKWYNDGRH